MSKGNQQSETDAKIFRQMAVTTSKASWDDAGMAMGQMRETQTAMVEKDGLVESPETIHNPLWLRMLQGILLLTAVVTGIYTLWGFLAEQLNGWVLLAFLLAAAVRGALAYRDYRREQNAWINRMGWNQKE
jgi:uncharacterized membrane-anchored protein